MQDYYDFVAKRRFAFRNYSTFNEFVSLFKPLPTFPLAGPLSFSIVVFGSDFYDWIKQSQRWDTRIKYKFFSKEETPTRAMGSQNTFETFSGEGWGCTPLRHTHSSCTTYTYIHTLFSSYTYIIQWPITSTIRTQFKVIKWKDL